MMKTIGDQKSRWTLPLMDECAVTALPSDKVETAVEDDIGCQLCPHLRAIQQIVVQVDQDLDYVIIDNKNVFTNGV